MSASAGVPNAVLFSSGPDGSLANASPARIAPLWGHESGQGGPFGSERHAIDAAAGTLLFAGTGIPASGSANSIDLTQVARRVGGRRLLAPPARVSHARLAGMRATNGPSERGSDCLVLASSAARGERVSRARMVLDSTGRTHSPENVMPLLARAALAALLLAAVAAPASAQLVNGGAETGSLSPWVPNLGGATTGNPSIIKAVTTQVQTAPPVSPATGGWFFSFATQPAGPSGSYVSLSQSVTVSGTAPLALTGRIQTEFGDPGAARLDILGAGGAVLASEELGPLVSDGAWSPFFLDVAVPPGAATCRVTLTGSVQTGVAINVFWDDLALFPSPWTIVGAGLAGTNGVPVIDGAGTLVGGEPVTLSLADARPQSAAWLVLGFTALQSPFKGGVLVPKPDLVINVPTGPLGALQLATTWSVGLPSGFSTWFQWWVQDPVAPLGFAASAGLRGTTP